MPDFLRCFTVSRVTPVSSSNLDASTQAGSTEASTVGGGLAVDVSICFIAYSQKIPDLAGLWFVKIRPGGALVAALTGSAAHGVVPFSARKAGLRLPGVLGGQVLRSWRSAWVGVGAEVWAGCSCFAPEKKPAWHVPCGLR